MTSLKTNPALLSALKDSAKRKVSPDVLRRQRVSFIMGSIGDKNNITRAQVEEILEKQEGRTQVK